MRAKVEKPDPEAKAKKRPASPPSSPQTEPEAAPEREWRLFTIGRPDFRLGVAVEHFQDTEAAIIKTLADPRLIGKPVQLKCKIAGISRTTWYRVISDPTFVHRARAAYRHALEVDRGAVMVALLQSATEPGREGHQDRKLFFQLLGDLDEAGERTKKEKGGDKASVLKAMSDEELIDTARELGLPLPAGVERRQEAKS